MNEFELFSQYVGNESELDSLLVRITSNENIIITSIQPIALMMKEEIDTGTPTITFDFIDGDGDLANHNIPQTGVIFHLDIGRDIMDLRRIKLKMSNLISINSGSGSERLAYRMVFVHHGWDKYYGQTYNRTWRSECPTNVVKQIATECGWENIITTACETRVECVQPNWTNDEMIKWLAGTTTMGSGRPRHVGRLDGTYVFKSVQAMIDDQSEDAMNGNIPVLRLGGQEDKVTREEDKKANHDIPSYFINYNIRESHAATRMSGGGGVRSYTYDSHTDTFMIDEWGVDDLEGKQMTDWTSGDGSLTNGHVYLYNGRGSENRQKAINKIAMATDDAVELIIVTEGSIDMRVGMMLEIIIPIPPNVNSSEPYNIMYSGFWMISGVEHAVNFKRSNMTTNVKMIRSGHDSKRLEGYKTTKGGKFVGRTT